MKKVIRVKNKRPRNDGGNAMHEMAERLDTIAEYERFREHIAPMLRDDLLKRRLSARQIQEKYAPYAVARIVTMALSEKDAGKALAAAKDLVDRAQGKAVERKSVAHKFAELDDQQLDAILVTKMKEIGNGKEEK